MKKIFTITLLLLFAISFGQNQERKIERIKNLRIAFISNKLDLSTEEAEKFWPIFNKFDDKQTKLLEAKRQLMQKLNQDNIPSGSSTQLLQDSEEIEINMQNNRAAYIKELQTVISAEKILILKKVEENFKKMLINRINK